MRLIGVASQFRMAEGYMPYRFWGLLEPYLERILPHLDSLLLPGGGDLDPTHYGEGPHPKLGEVSPERDAHELFLARYAAEKGLPALGICRGIQVMNVALGGTLYQDLEAQGFTEVEHRQKSPPPALAHSVRQVADGPLSHLFPEEFPVNSYHHQGLKTLGEGLKPLAVAPDGLAEAVVLEGHPLFLGVQWHPELLREHWAVFGLFRE
ncbi:MULTISPECIES: gamma-glutamyl-gamma-aminobutyrate hydrolase family protein [Thermus]|uniref:gamma-glutamyl-gamma-aminobutyrate hydrolase family protein n=1 Tax=Thermus TaxID=270 RepID=UPI001F2732B2|nr:MULTISPECIES: gamma-glutamyl-gamma-aminobutyrate hydrolase family protein [Thermus]